MDMIFCPLYSGSSGNALFVQAGPTRLLIDAGKPGKTVGEALLEPTRIYVKSVLATLKEVPGAVHALAHITGGGITENLDREIGRASCRERV